MLTRNGSNISIKGRLLGASPATALRDSSLTGNPLPRVHCGGLSRYASLPVGYRNDPGSGAVSRRSRPARARGSA